MLHKLLYRNNRKLLSALQTFKTRRGAIEVSSSGPSPRYNCRQLSHQAGKSWVPTKDDTLQRVTTLALVHEISLQQMEATAKVVPWFLKAMPASYFRQIPEPMRRQHLSAVTSIRELKQSNLSLRIDSFPTPEITEITIISSDPKPGLLLSQLRNIPIPADSHLSKVRVFSSSDNELALNIYTFEKHVSPSSLSPPKVLSDSDTEKLFAYIEEESSHGRLQRDETFMENLKGYILKCSPTYVRECSPRRFLMQKDLCDRIRGTDGCTVDIESTSSFTWITIAAANVLTEELFKVTAGLLTARGLDIIGAHLDTVAASEEDSVTMLRVMVSPDVTKLFDTEESLSAFKLELGRAKWYDDDTLHLGLAAFPSLLGVQKAEVITAFSGMLHGILSKQNPHEFASVKSIYQVIGRSQHFTVIAASIAQLFLDRFRPEKIQGSEGFKSSLSEIDFQRRSQEILSKIAVLQFEPAKVLLTKMVEAVKSTLRTNFYHPDRYALSLRISPHLMMTGQDPSKPLPFGVFFVHGRNFNAFHCRFRDIARGGLRIVTPSNSEQLALESTRLFDEVYGLSFAQQLKNKDIPEGGAKGVILVNSASTNSSTNPNHSVSNSPSGSFPGSNVKHHTTRASIRAFTDSMLDLIVHDSVKSLVDFYGKPELIYLGPDEQVIPSDIDYICQRAKQRGYPMPAAFMSSKKRAGFNHKEYGVTSEGVVVYLDVALKSSLSIDPKTTPFTVKITGGPDGDVAGNLIKILFRDYGDNPKILGIADGFGVAEDPQGLDRAELLRLVDESLPITSFQKSKLSPEGILMNVQSEEGLSRRNTMHFRVKTDAFIPAGGRPNTINAENYHLFIDSETGKPSSPLIVEGANLFLTKEAREGLFTRAGVKIVKDSSANKCGVITSSCEIAASMLISEEEFMEVKEELVQDVLDKLRYLARLEAELLFREFVNYPGALPHFSERISMAIGKVTDAMTNLLETQNPGDPLFEELFPLVTESMPKKLANMAGSRASSRLPVQYQRNAIASALASQLVYNEGIHFVETQPLEVLADRAVIYFRERCALERLLSKLRAEGWENLTLQEKGKVLNLLERGGARTAMGVF